MDDSLLLKPCQRLATGRTAGITPNKEWFSQGSLSEQVLHSTDEAVRAFTHTIGRAGAHGDVTIDACAAAQAVIGRAISQIHLFDIAAWGEVLGTFNNLDYASSALANATAVVEIVQALIGIDACRKRCFAQIGPLDATDLLAFLLKTDGGHGGRSYRRRPT